MESPREGSGGGTILVRGWMVDTHTHAHEIKKKSVNSFIVTFCYIKLLCKYLHYIPQTFAISLVNGEEISEKAWLPIWTKE